MEVVGKSGGWVGGSYVVSGSCYVFLLVSLNPAADQPGPGIGLVHRKNTGCIELCHAEFPAYAPEFSGCLLSGEQVLDADAKAAVLIVAWLIAAHHAHLQQQQSKQQQSFTSRTHQHHVCSKQVRPMHALQKSPHMASANLCRCGTGQASCMPGLSTRPCNKSLSCWLCADWQASRPPPPPLTSRGVVIQ